MPILSKQKKLINNALWLGLTLIVFACLLKLSFWQYARGVDKEHRIDRIAQLNQQSPLTLDEIVEMSQTKQFSGDENINDFPVTIDGQFNSDYVFLLDNQVEQGSLGYRVLQVVTTTSYAVLINLGWVQGSIHRSELPKISSIQGQHKFQGHVRIIEKGITLKAQDFSKVSWPLRVQEIDLDKFSTLIAKPLLPFVIYANKNETIGFKKNWHPIVMPPEKHFGYSFQWAALAIVWLILMISLKRKNQTQAKKTVLITNDKTQKTTTNNKNKAIKYG